jgi:hypothetical protein
VRFVYHLKEKHFLYSNTKYEENQKYTGQEKLIFKKCGKLENFNSQNSTIFDCFLWLKKHTQKVKI